MTYKQTIRNCAAAVLLCGLPFALPGQVPGVNVEPNAGNWKTWAIPSGKEFRAPAPPNADSTRNELAWLKTAVAEQNPSVVASMNYWSAGAPSYRWMQLITDRINAGQPVTGYSHRVYAYVAMAMYDATVATWESKYAYNRPRPNQLDPTLKTRLPTPQSPSYPSEHAATAAAAAAVLSYLVPGEAASFQALADEAGKAQLYAGTEFPSDYFAGQELGRRVAERVIQIAKADRSEIPWSGTAQTGKCAWFGPPVPPNLAAVNWQPLLLKSAAEFRPPPPPACDSPQVTAELAVVRDFPRSPAAFNTNQKALYWQSSEGLNYWPLTYADKWMFEEHLDQNPPRAARTYALIALSFYDAFIASQDGKITYWYIRPNQLDPSITPTFPVPPFPSYPSNHSTFSATRSEVLAYLFPNHADEIRAVGKEAGDSRIWGGLHYPMDNLAGVNLGRSVAQKFIAWASSDGSQ